MALQALIWIGRADVGFDYEQIDRRPQDMGQLGPDDVVGRTIDSDMERHVRFAV